MKAFSADDAAFAELHAICGILCRHAMHRTMRWLDALPIPVQPGTGVRE